MRINNHRIGHRATRSFHLLAIIMLLAGCSGRNEASLEVWEGGAYEPREVTAYEVTGKRDGATTRVVATFTLAGGDQLRVQLEVTYDPTPALGSGRWSFDGTPSGAGEVRSESVKFLGGQGEGPSFGGRFRLEENGSPRYRVVLPLRPVESRKWTVQ